MFLRSSVLPLLRAFPSPFASRGNWGVDLQAGSDFGYKLLFVVLLAGFFAVILQVTFFVYIPRCYVILIRFLKGLTCKLGVVTGLGKIVSLKHAFISITLIRTPGSVRPRFPLSTSLLQPVKAPQVLSMVHFISSICLFRDSHYQHRFGRASWFGNRSQSTLP